jgi:prepilin peptidase CpaA
MAINPQITYLTAALLCASIGSLHDLRSRRIPNLLTGPAILFGLLLHLAVGGLVQLGLSALAGLIAGGIFFLFFVAGGMGAGDVKLMAAVGCLAGTAHLKEVLVATVLVGALMGLALALYRGRLRETVANVVTLVQHHSAEGLATHPELNVKNTATLRLPYALPIAAGCLLTFFLSSGKELVR